MTEFDPHTSSEKPAEAPPPPKKYVKRTAFFITAAVIFLVLFAAAVMDPLVALLRYIINLLAPLFIGGIIAYLCDPILQMYEYRVFKRMKKGDFRRGISLFLTVITAFGIVALVLLMMVPQLLASINELMSNYELYVNRFLGWLQSVLDSATANLPVNVVDISTIEKLTEYLSQMFGSFENSYNAIFEQLTQILAEENVIEKLWGLLLTLFNSIKNLFIGLFIAFYLLASKEKRIAQMRNPRRF